MIKTRPNKKITVYFQGKMKQKVFKVLGQIENLGKSSNNKWIMLDTSVFTESLDSSFIIEWDLKPIEIL